jgi:hypothetical protein
MRIAGKLSCGKTLNQAMGAPKGEMLGVRDPVFINRVFITLLGRPFFLARDLVMIHVRSLM